MRRFWIFDGSTLLTTGFGFWIEEKIDEASSGLCECVSEIRISKCQFRNFTMGDALCALRSGRGEAGEKVPRIGYVGSTFASTQKEIFRQVLRDLGYIEGENIHVEYHYIEGQQDRALGLVAELVEVKVDVLDLAVKSRLPAIYYAPEWVEDGGLMSYGVSFTDLNRRAAIYVDKILKGAKPADIPVEQPKKFEFVINLKAAKQIGLTIPPNVLARADRVIR